MSDLISVIKLLLKDVVLFTRYASGLSLRSYQEQAARAIVDSVIQRRGDTFVVLFPRQSGKNELQAQIETYLLTLFSQTPAEMVKVSPTWKPQSLNAMRRLERVLERNWFTRGRWKKESGYIYRVGSARLTFLSGAPETNIVGATASTLLEIDEAQDVSIAKYDKDIAPMAASTNATRVFWGTAWTSQTLLARELRAALEAEKKDGRQRVFRLTADEVAQEVPAYGQFVAEQIAKLGRNHPMIRTQFFSEEIDAQAGMFPSERIALLQGHHPRRHSPEPGKLYALLLDVAGEDEVSTPMEAGQLAFPSLTGGQPLVRQAHQPLVRQAHQPLVRQAHQPLVRQAHQPLVRQAHQPRLEGGGFRDATALSVVEVDLSTLSDPALRAPTYRIVDRKAWIGVKHSTLYAQIKALAEHWQARYLVIDATGIGAGLASFLEKALPGKVIPFVFNAATKSRLGWDFLSLIESGRLKDYATQDAEKDEFIAQLQACQMEVLPGPEHRLRWGVAEGRRPEYIEGRRPEYIEGRAQGEFIHDDWILSAALCTVLDEQPWAISAPPLLIHAPDPLRQMDQEGY